MINEQTHLWRSLAGGEVAEELYGRFDLTKNQTGLKRCYNFQITPQGVAFKRSGSEFIAEAGSATVRLETFIAPDGQGFLLEIFNLQTNIYLNGDLADFIGTPWNQAELPVLQFAQFVDDLSVCSNNYAPYFIRRVANFNWTGNNIVFNATLAAPASLTATPWEITSLDAGDPRIGYRYAVTTLTDTGAESAISSVATANNILRIAGCNNSLSWPAVSGAFRYNVYGAREQGNLGFIGSAESTSFVDDNINPDQLTQPPAVLASFTTSVNYPRCVAFHAQRFLLANTPDDPQSFWASGLAGFEYFKASVPPQDDQAFTYQLATKRASPIRHMLALRDLLFFTNTGVHRVFATSGNFTASTVDAIQVSAFGAKENVRPQEASNSVLYPEARSSHLIALRYDGAGEGYEGDDLSLLAPHLIDGYEWVQTGFQNTPYPVWWGLRDDGRLIGLTYVAEQEVFAWFQVELPGATIRSFAVVPEGANDSIYVHVQRFIDGDFVYYIERIKPQFGNRDLQSQAFFVDCGKTFNGGGLSTLTGLEFLEGEEVVALVDGQPMGPYTVTGGEITIDEPTQLIATVGLAYAAELETLPVPAQVQGLGVGHVKNASAVHLRLKRSEGVEAGPDFDRLRPLEGDETSLIGAPITLRDGVHTITLDPEWNVDGLVVIRQNMPLPAIITGIALDFSGAQ
jgi:hypothetical protein